MRKRKEEVISLEKGTIEKVMTGMSSAEKREVLSSLVTTLLKDLNEAEKEEMLRAVASGRREGRRLAGLVDE
jgi:CHASE3 domain sensor protein